VRCLLFLCYGHGLFLDEDLFVQVLNVTLQQLVVNNVVFVHMVGVVGFKNHIQDLVENLVCYFLHCYFFYFFGAHFWFCFLVF
jgi:hypothetical protein